MDDDAEAEFLAFVRERSPELQRMAWLLTGDQSSAQDLLQSSLLRVWTRWRNVRRRDAPLGYVHRVMTSTFLSWRSRRWVGEVATEWLREEPDPADIAADLATRRAVVDALQSLPRQQRAVIVLRYFADLTEQATADALGCGVGTVKSHASRALKSLRSDRALREAITERADDGRL